MRNYDFHELLSDEEFQQFAASIVSIKENKKLRINRMTHDKGVDFYDLEDTIIGQAKKHNNNFNSLKNSLIKEVERAKQSKDKRYILVTSAELEKTDKEKLVTMFEGCLKLEDILDKNELNQLLEEPQYHKIEIEYLKLLVPNSFVLKHLLEKLKYKELYLQTEIELKKIKTSKKIFSPTEEFYMTLNKLSENNSIIISGEPGVGKSTIGRMLCANIINNNPEIEFFCIKTIDELYQAYDKDNSQLYFFDDFFGDTKYNFMISPKEQDKLIDFINYIKESNNKWFILTTREYVFQDGLNINKKEKDKFSKYKYELKIENISKTSKFNILYNHLIKTDLTWEHLNIILNNWTSIINNQNYTPRFIETFLDNYKNYKELSDIDFLKKFINNIDEPFEYWKEILIKQPLEIILLLITMSLNFENRMDIKILENRFNYLISIKKITKDINLTFKDYIKKLEDTFALTNIYEDKLYIEFKNPSYKDFIIDYLSKNISSYISYIYDEILSLKEAMNLWQIINKKMEINKNLKEINLLDNMILKRMIEEPKEEYYNNLIFLAEATDFNYESKIKKLVIANTIELLENSEDLIYEDYDNYNAIFPLLSILKDKYDFSIHIKELLFTITFHSSDIDDLERLTTIKKLYPNIYEEYYKEYKKEIKKMLSDRAITDAIYYKKVKDAISIEILVNEEIPKIYDELEITIPAKLKETLEQIESEVYEMERKTKPTKKPTNYKPIRNTEPKKEDLSVIEEKIKQLKGDTNYIYDVNKFLNENNISPKIKKIIKSIDNDYEDITIFNSITKNKQTLLLLCEYLKNNKLELNQINFLESFVKYIKKKNNLTENDYIKICNMSFVLMKNNKAIFTIEELKNTKDIYVDDNIEKILNSDFFIRRDKWYHFVHPLIQIYITLKTIINLELDVDIMHIIKLIEKYDCSWFDVDEYNYTNITTYKLIELLFSKKWSNFVKEKIDNFIKKINTKDEISIAKSILRYFDIKISYKFHVTSMSFNDYILHDIIIMYLESAIMDLFVLDSDCNTRELVKLYEKYPGNNEENTLSINEYLNSQKFIRILKENNIIEEINIMYNKLINLKNKLNKEEKVTE